MLFFDNLPIGRLSIPKKRASARVSVAFFEPRLDKDFFTGNSIDVSIYRNLFYICYEYAGKGVAGYRIVGYSDLSTRYIAIRNGVGFLTQVQASPAARVECVAIDQCIPHARFKRNRMVEETSKDVIADIEAFRIN